ncbi:MAG: metallophosphoesterase [Clostridia bacterium]|nr:metallophosphoesterase [Clostridia bacterium]
MKKRLFCILLCLVMSFSLICIVSAGSADDSDFMTFKAYGVYKTAAPLDAVPATYEAWVRIPESRTGPSHIILGNDLSNCYNSFQFHITENGAPMIKFVNKVPNGVLSTRSYTFSNSAANTGKWVHVAITADTANQTISCYINGELSESKAFPFVPQVSPLPLVLGGDNRSGNTSFFKGQLRSTTIFSDVRTPAEIAADMAAVNIGDENLMAHYDLTAATFGNDIGDAAGNYDMKYINYWFDTVTPVTEYAYSMAIIGDQQIISISYPDKLHCIYDWILANKQAKNIEYVMALGDITNERDNATEWARVQAQFQRLSGKIPFAVCRGNHDYSAPYNTYLNFAGYTSDIVGNYDGRLEDMYKLIKIGKTDYLIMSLDYGASDGALAWACDVVERYPNHKVIVITHSYMADDGTTTDAHDPVAPSTNSGYNNGDDMWEKFVRKYENIVLVLSGHIDSDEIRATKAVGDHGNIVTQMLINPQGIDPYTPTGMVCMLYFNEDGNVVTTDYYSTIRNQYFNIGATRYTMYLGERSGDCNGDGTVTVADAVAAISAMLGKAEYKNADVNGDGKVTVSDVLSIIKDAAKGV